MMNKGFSLIQLAVIVAAAGLVAAAALPSREGDDVNAKYLLTKQRMQKIDDATVKMMATWGRRPCPASGMYKPGDAEFGVENGTAGTCTGGAGANGIMSVASNVVAGMVPVRKLHLSEEYAFDGWGRPFTYVVDTRATARGTCVATDFVKGGINVVDGGTEISAMQLLISHGPDGYGSYLPQGSTNANRFNDNSTDADQIKNAGGVDFSTPNANSYVKKDKTSTFDDFLFYSDRYKNNCCLGKICKEPSGGTAEAEDYAVVGGSTAGARLGKAMNFANVAGDTKNDLIFANDPAQPATANKIYVLVASDDAPPTPITLNLLDANNVDALGYTITTESPINDFAIGDVNGDGQSDIVMAGDGWAAAVFGASGAYHNISVGASSIDGTSDGSRGFYISQDNSTHGVFGKSIAVGNVDDDRIEDIVIGQFDLTEPLDETKAKGKINLILGRSSWSFSNTNSGLLDGTNGFAFLGWGYSGGGIASTNPALAMGYQVAILAATSNDEDSMDQSTAILVSSKNQAASPAAKSQAFIIHGLNKSEYAANGWNTAKELSAIAAGDAGKFLWISHSTTTGLYNKLTELSYEQLNGDQSVDHALSSTNGTVILITNPLNSYLDSQTPYYDTTGVSDYGTYYTMNADPGYGSTLFSMVANTAGYRAIVSANQTSATSSKVVLCDLTVYVNCGGGSTPIDEGSAAQIFYSNTSPTFGSSAAFVPFFFGLNNAFVIADPDYDSGGNSASGAIYVMFDWGASNDFSSGTPPGDVGEGGSTTIEPY